MMEASNHRRMEVMAAPRKYPDELRERAIHFALDLLEGRGRPGRGEPATSRLDGPVEPGSFGSGVR